MSYPHGGSDDAGARRQLPTVRVRAARTMSLHVYPWAPHASMAVIQGEYFDAPASKVDEWERAGWIARAAPRA